MSDHTPAPRKPEGSEGLSMLLTVLRWLGVLASGWVLLGSAALMVGLGTCGAMFIAAGETRDVVPWTLLLGALLAGAVAWAAMAAIRGLLRSRGRPTASAARVRPTLPPAVHHNAAAQTTSHDDDPQS